MKILLMIAGLFLLPILSFAQPATVPRPGSGGGGGGGLTFAQSSNLVNNIIVSSNGQWIHSSGGNGTNTGFHGTVTVNNDINVDGDTTLNGAVSISSFPLQLFEGLFVDIGNLAGTGTNFCHDGAGNLILCEGGGSGTGSAFYGSTTTVLTNGEILVVGGFDASGGITDVVTRYTTNGAVVSTSTLNNKRAFHTATLLENGRVLVAGGLSGSNALASAELYDVDVNTWVNTGSMASNRFGHTAQWFADGVLVTGGRNFNSNSILYAEKYIVGPGSWTASNPFDVRTNQAGGQFVMTPGGNVGIGTPAPAANFDLPGRANIGTLNATSIIGGVTFAPSNGIRFTVVSGSTGDTNFISLTDQVALTKTNWANNTASGPSNIANLVLLSKVHPTNEVGAAAVDFVGSVFTTGATGTNTFRPTGRITMVPNVASPSLVTWVFQTYTNSILVNGEWIPASPATTNFYVTTTAQGGQAFFGAGISINGITFTRGGADILQSSGRLLLPSDLGVATLVPTARIHGSGGTNEFLLRLSSTIDTNLVLVTTNYVRLGSNIVHVPTAAEIGLGGTVYWNSNGSHWLSRCLDGSTVEHKSQWE